MPAESTIWAPARSSVRWTVPAPNISCNLGRKAGSLAATRSPSGCSTAAVTSWGFVWLFIRSILRSYRSKAFNQRHRISAWIEADQIGVMPEDLDSAPMGVLRCGLAIPGRAPIEAFAPIPNRDNQAPPLDPQHTGDALA